MKRMYHWMIALLAACMLALPAMGMAEEAYGSAAVSATQPYTLEQMLTYALEDEYMAQAEYAGILATLGGDAPFGNIIKAEDQHIALLQPLFDAYQVSVPENDASQRVAIPATLAEAYTLGVQAENANIAMYEAFLAQENVPEDVRTVFTALRNASQSHLAAFTRNTENGGQGMGQRQNNRQSDDTQAQNQCGTANCPMDGTCKAVTTDATQGNRGSGNGRRAK